LGERWVVVETPFGGERDDDSDVDSGGQVVSEARLISAEVVVDVERGTSGIGSVSRWLVLAAVTSACRRRPGARGVGRDGEKIRSRS
jgi:hypothetical protein